MELRLQRIVSLPRFTFARALDICYIRPVVQKILWEMARYSLISNAKTREALRTALSEHRFQAKIALLFRSVEEPKEDDAEETEDENEEEDE